MPFLLPALHATAGGIMVITAGKQLVLSGLNSPATLSLFDLAGRKIAGYTNIGNNQPLPVNYNGILIVKIENETQSAAAKIYNK